MAEMNVPPLRWGKFKKGGINPDPGAPPPDFHPAPMGIPFQTPGPVSPPENGKHPPVKP